MKKINQSFLILVSCGIVACGGGASGGSNSNGGGATVGNYTQLTPAGGININDSSSAQSVKSFSSTMQNVYTSFGNNGSTLYAGTSTGQLLQMNPNYTGWVQVTSAPNNLPIIAISSNNSNGVYYAPYPSITGYSYPGDNTFNVGSDGYLTAITSSNNGSIYYGTDLGNVGLTNNPAGKQIPTIPTPEYGPILSVGCTSGSCNSGQQGLLVFQAESAIIPAFESTTFSESPNLYAYPSQMYYLDLGTWVNAGYSNTVSTSRTVTIESTTYTNVPEFITTVTINPNNSTIYAGTNFYNIYSASLHCNHGQGCNIAWGSSINTVPLSNVTNGSQGITSITVLSNGSLYVVGNYSESVVGVYQSQSTSN